MSASPVRWGVLGTGGIAETVVPAMRRASGCAVSAVASREQASADAFGRRHDIPLTFGSYDNLLRSGAVDAVYVPLPNALHAEWTVAAVEAGLPVLCEKPLATSAAEAELIVAAVEANDGLVVEAFMYRLQPLYELLREPLDDGSLGCLKAVDAVFTFALDEPDSIVASAALGGGALLDVGCYAVDAIRWLGGAEPRTVAAFARYDGVDRAMVGVLDLANGVLGRFETGIDAAESHRLELTFTDARVVVDDPWVPSGPVGIRIERHGREPEVRVAPAVDAWQAQVEQFARAVRTGCAPHRSLEESVANLRVLDALARAARDRAVVALD